MQLKIDTTFTKALPADSIKENYVRKVDRACFSYVLPATTSNPKLVHVSSEFAQSLGFAKTDLKSKAFLNLVSGNTIYPNTKPYAMNYGGHQFGHWAGQLGDGRAINLFEIKHNNQRWALQLKGAGKTPYSRQGDGLAVLRSSIREYLCSEAMHHLGVPTTRALSLALTGDQVLRDMLYNGNAEYEPGAIVCRVSPTFIRFGSFEILAAQQDIKTLKQLANYTIKHFYSHLGEPSKETYIQFFAEVSQRTLEMIIHWQRVGFVHGVMNTDNMSILGLTIDYGPYGWLEGFDFGWTPNTTDAQHKRYRFGNQPNIALWNLYQLANALYPLIEDAKPLEDILNQFKTDFDVKSLQMMRSKLGLFEDDNTDKLLIQNLEDNLLLTETDMTIFFRKLSELKKDESEQGLSIISEAFYAETISKDIKEKWNKWFTKYVNRLQQEQLSDDEREQKMNQVNPKYVLRNYMAQLAIDDAEKGDYKLLDELFTMLQNPYNDQPKYNKWFAKRPEWARHKVGCSMLSCSS
ncbi:protein adenylyltransferase SelO [Mangrovimonas spongiae]|uniref:Protein nucleotidyltransferase YdiU n=1 Tax=Mangrovimonas spongiae TaxID=2494697 RepID=A0A428K6N6_9FLAO|nr:YdiU family protein [Mangrovimonas spongiae]RSK42148.1 YdiU family protein [Mangrovimonas spongiae]